MDAKLPGFWAFLIASKGNPGKQWWWPMGAYQPHRRSRLSSWLWGSGLSPSQRCKTEWMIMLFAPLPPTSNLFTFQLKKRVFFFKDLPWIFTSKKKINNVIANLLFLCWICDVFELAGVFTLFSRKGKVTGGMLPACCSEHQPRRWEASTLIF